MQKNGKRKMLIRLFLFSVFMGVLYGHFLGNVSIKAAADYDNTETKRVAMDESVTIAEPGKYKDMDYSFMRVHVAGEDHMQEVAMTFNTAEKLQSSRSQKLVLGAYVLTKGYYAAEDGGAACYQIVDEDIGSCIALTSGYYAKLIPDTYKDTQGTVWALFDVKQFGAKADGKNEDNCGINNTIRYAGNYVKDQNGIDRGLVYLPKGEYKCTDQLFADTQNLNIVGEGDDTIIFTDNDYRKKSGYSEHFFQITSAKNMFFGNFKIEAREVDLYHYMRQFTLTYCEEIYVYQVDLIVPQESYNSYYFEDKQYSNFCCYCGNTNVTVDGCTMKQLSGTYRGANLGILDIWSKGEKNITVMNCDLYGNARDEQIGFFSTEVESASVKNVDFINNTVHSVQLKYTDIVGTRTMCFSIAYADSQNVEDIRVAGNHFICETDSKFMTFGSVKNCVVEDNIIEIVASNGYMGSVFDTGNMEPENILVRNNQFYISSKTGKEGKTNIINGAVTFTKNKLFLDSEMALHMMYLNCKVDDNQIVALKKFGNLADNVYSFCNNTVTAYGGFDRISVMTMTDKERDVNISGNIVYNYNRWFGYKYQTGPWVSLHMIDGLNLKSYNYKDNKYYAPNRKFLENDESHSNFLYVKTGDGSSTINYSGNVSQGVKGIINYGSLENSTVNDQNNTILPYDVDPDEKIVSSIDLQYKNENVKEISLTGDEVDLSAVVKIGTQTDEDGNVTKEEETTDKKLKWYSSVDAIATVSADGKVSRHMYGDVKIYVVPLDGSTNYGCCIIHFEKACATDLKMTKDTIELQPNLRFYAEYKVLPETASQTLSWSSSDERIATVSKEGLITAVTEGTAVITGKTLDGSNIAKTIEVKVSPLTVKQITLSSDYQVLDSSYIGKTVQLSVKSYYPENATNKGISKWTTNHEDVVSVDDDGLVHILAAGGVRIFAYSMDGTCYGCCNLYIKGGQVPNVRVTNLSDTSAKIDWDRPGLTGWGFNIYRWNFTTSEWETLNTNYYYEGYEAKDLEKNTKYRYAISYFIKGYDTGKEVVYDGEKTPIEFTTRSYKPVEKISGDKFISLVYGSEPEIKFYYDPYNADYPDLKFDAEIEDTNVVEITQTRVEGNKIYINLKINNYGCTNITVKCNDDKKAEITVPIGVTVKDMVKTETFHAEYEDHTVKVSFGAIKDETNIDGYYLTGIGEPVFVPKTGADTYTYVYHDGFMYGNTYEFRVAPCVTDGTYYYAGYLRDGAKVTLPEATLLNKIYFDEGAIVLPVGQSREIKAYYGPEDVENSELDWYTENESIATVSGIKKKDDTELAEYALVTGTAVGVTKIQVDATDASKLSTEKTLAIIPNQVLNLTALAKEQGNVLTWTPIEGVQGYKVYRQAEEGQAWKEEGDCESASYTDVNLSASQKYSYKVVAYVQGEDGTKYEGAACELVSVMASSNYVSPAPTLSPDENGLSGLIPDTQTGNLPASNENGSSSSSETTIVPTNAPSAGDGNLSKVDTADVNLGDTKLLVQGYLGTYDGKAHEACTISGKTEALEILYSVDGENWVKTVPMVTNVADNKEVQVRISVADTKQVHTVKVKAVVNPISLENCSMSLDRQQIPWSETVTKPVVQAVGMTENVDYVVSYPEDGNAAGTYTVMVSGKGNYIGSQKLSYTIEVKVGETYIVKGYRYKITGATKVTLLGGVSKSQKKIIVKAMENIGGNKYKVTAIGKAAFKDCKQLKRVVIGKNVTKILAKCFAGDKKLKQIDIRSKKIVKIEKNAWKNIDKNAAFVLKKKSIKKKLSKKTGFSVTMKMVIK